MRQITKRAHSTARDPVATNWMIEKITMPVATSKQESSTPARIIPPAIPNRPEMNDVEMMLQAMRTKSKGVMRAIRASHFSHVMAELVPAIHDLVLCAKDVDARQGRA